MIANNLDNSELLADALPDGPLSWPLAGAQELEEKVWPWPVSPAVPSKTTLPELVLAMENQNRLVASSWHSSQPRKRAAATNSIAFSPRLLSNRPTSVYSYGVTNTFVHVSWLKLTEEKLRQNQQQLESLKIELEALVAERTEQVRRLASEVMIAQQQVQQTISKILHDEVQQLLVGIQIQSAILKGMLPAGDQALLDRIQEIRDIASLALQATRQVATDLAPPLLLYQGFMESLDFLAAQMNERYGLKVELKGALPPGCPRQEVGNLLFQIVRELLFNVVKHAGVNEATIEVFEKDGRLTVGVSDHGQGFDVSASAPETKHHSGLGLTNIRNRLEIFGGQFHIESQVGQGTRATVVVLV